MKKWLFFSGLAGGIFGFLLGVIISIVSGFLEKKLLISISLFFAGLFSLFFIEISKKFLEKKNKIHLFILVLVSLSLLIITFIKVNT